MSDILAITRAHFAQTRSITIPEWVGSDGKPVVFYWKPLTGDEQASLKAKSDAKQEGQQAYAVRVLIEKATDDAGQKVFSMEDMPALMSSADYTILQRIAGTMLTPTTVESAEKN